MMHNKVILTDADGVLLDWIYAFDQWMLRHEYKIIDPNAYRVADRYGEKNGYRMAKMFNESAWIRKLPPHKDAIKYVKKLHEEHGYVFHVITSLSDDEYSQHLRTKNLRELFGDTVFERYIYLDTGADKDQALEFYRNTECWWLEDKYENYKLGEQLGLKCLLMEHEHNKHAKDECRTINNWKEAYQIITGN